MQSERFEIRLSPELLRRLDEWRLNQTVPPSRAAAIRQFVERALSDLEKDENP